MGIMKILAYTTQTILLGFMPNENYCLCFK